MGNTDGRGKKPPRKKHEAGPRAKNVRLDIFNIIGQKVTTLINDFLPPGQHQVEWNSTGDNGQKVASGVYLYKLQVGQESQTKKMLLLK